MKEEFRTLQTEDFNELAELAEIIWHQRYDSLLVPQQIDYMLEKYQSVEALLQQKDHGYVYRGLFLDEKLAGFTGSVSEENAIFLSKLYLHRDHWLKGYGRRLLQDVIEFHGRKDYLYLTVNKYNPSVEFYRHVGFYATDSIVTDIGSGFVMDDYVMRIDLI